MNGENNTEHRSEERYRDGDKIIIRRRVRKKRSGRSGSKSKKLTFKSVIKIAVAILIVLALCIVLYNIFSGFIK